MPYFTGPRPTATLQLTVRVALLPSTDQRAPIIGTAQITALAALIAGSATEGWS
jgi:hypothetical protein